MNLYITATQARHFQVFHDGKLLAEGRMYATQGIIGNYRLRSLALGQDVEREIDHCLSKASVVRILHEGGSCYVNGTRQAATGYALVVRMPADDDAQQPDTRAGSYYVSARDGDRYWLLAGPWPTHAEALAQVEPVWEHARRVDPVGSEWKAFGTCRLEPDGTSSPSVLGVDPEAWKYVEPEPERPKRSKRPR